MFECVPVDVIFATTIFGVPTRLLAKVDVPVTSPVTVILDATMLDNVRLLNDVWDT